MMNAPIFSDRQIGIVLYSIALRYDMMIGKISKQWELLQWRTMMKRLAVVFDMDGVLVDSEPANLEQLAQFFAQYDVIASDEFMHSLVGSSIEYTARECTKLLHKDWSIEEFNAYFDEFALTHPVLYKEILHVGAKETITWLREKGFATAIASSAPFANIQRMIQECELDGLFDVILSGEMFEESKPNPEIYITAAQKLGVAPEACVAVEDSHFGIEAGKRAGMYTVAYEDERFGTDQSKADTKIQTLSGLIEVLS